MKSYDIVIVGGGFVGISALLALGRLSTHLKIALIDTQEAEISRVSSPADMRSIVLSYAAQRIFSQWGCWEKLSSQVAPLLAVHISQAGCLGRVRITAAEQGVPALGYVIPADQLGLLLKNCIPASCDYFYGTSCIDMQRHHEAMELKIRTQDGKEERWFTKLVLAADGANSNIRKWADIPVKQLSYSQQAIVTHVQVGHPNQTGYERFIGSEALAMVPRLGNTYGVIWKVNDQRAQTLLSLSNDAFLKALQSNFGYRLGKLSHLGKRQIYHLKLIRALKETLPGIVLLGDAAHSNPPIAAQGFNLSLRDIAVLADRIEEAVKARKEFYSAEFLQQYEDLRLRDQAKIVSLVNLPLTRTFEWIPSALKGFAWLGMDVCGGVRSAFANTMMGLLP